MQAVKPGVAHSGLLSNRLQGVLRSRTFTIDTRYIHWLVAGRGARISVVVDGYEKIRDPIYGGLTAIINDSDQLGWATLDVGMWMGHSAYLEIADGAAVNFSGATTVLDQRPWLHRGRRDSHVQRARAVADPAHRHRPT